MHDILIFRNEEFGSIRTVEVDGATYFVAKDVAEALGYTNPRKAITDHVLDEDKGVTKCDTLGGKQDLTVINESGLYALIFGSKLESAKRFKHWVTSEVLPAIRKTGQYQKQLTPQEIMRIQLGMIDDHENRIVNLENNMVIDYGQSLVLGDTVNRTVTEILGGKNSDAYAELSRKVFAECNRDIKHYFEVNARSNIPKKRFEESLEYVKMWRPCANTMMMIRNCNAQNRMVI